MQMKKACIKKNSSLEKEDEKNSIIKNIALDDVDEKNMYLVMLKNMYYKNIALDDVEKTCIKKTAHGNIILKKHCT